MDNQPSIDRTILLPILIGAFSIFGILILLLIGRLNASRASLPVEETETPFKYIFLGTEPGLFTESSEATETDLLSETSTPFDGAIATATPRPPGVTATLVTPNVTGGPPGNNQTVAPPINITLPGNTSLPTSTSLSASSPPLNAGTYDDTHNYLVYDGPGWASPTAGGGDCGPITGTLHVSTTLGSSVSFRFIGWELRLRYQAAPSLGTITIRIDNINFDPLIQTDTTTHIVEWVSPDPLSQSTHNVTITHLNGGSVNLDCVIVRDALATSTVTATLTRTPATPP
jgi:hypothetical protein